MTTLLQAKKESAITASAPRKRICFPIEGFTLSGGMRIIIQIANGLACAGHAVRFIVPDYNAVPPFPLEPSVVVETIATQGAGKRRKLNYLLQLCRLAAHDADVCFATGFKTPLYIYFSSRLNRSAARRIYLIQHYEAISHVEQSTRSRPAKLILRVVANLGYKLPFEQIVVSRWIAEQLNRPESRIISYGVDSEIFQPRSETDGRETAKFVVGIIERAAPWKGYATFLEALRLLPEAERDNIKICIASQDQVALPEGIESERIFPRNDRDMAAFYQKCDLFVLASTVEGFGLPPLEAMACGVPVLTTDCGGVREFADEANAVFIPPGNPAAMATALQALKHNAAKRDALREAGLKTARSRTIPQMLEKYAQFIASR